MRRILVLLLWGGAVSCESAPTSVSEQEMETRFQDLARRYVDEAPALSPVSATSLGDHRFDGELDDVGPASRARRASFYRRYLEELEQIHPEMLSRDSQVDAALLEKELRARIWSLEVLREWSWNPLRYTALPGNAVYSLMARDFAPLEERLSNVRRRLEKFPRLFDQVRATLRPSRVPRVHVEKAIEQNRGVLGILENTVRPHLSRLPEGEREALEKAIEIATGAVEAQQKWLEEELLPRARGNYRLGPELYDRKLAFTLKSSLSRREIRRRADRELARVREEMYALSREIYAREYPHTRFPGRPSKEYRQAIIRACLEMAYQRTPARDRMVEEARRTLEQVTTFVREKDLVTIPEDPVEIIIMPEFRRGITLAYCDAPGPLAVGQKTYYAISPLPESWTGEQVRSFLREYNLLSLTNLTVHEAMPGHFLQLAHSNRHPSTLRALLSSGVFIEGWAVYAENMLIQAGLLAEEPLMRLIVLKWLLRAIANAIIDQEIHAGSMRREEAMELMIEETFQEEREAAAKWVRAQLTSTQLSTYFVGYLEHVDLRSEVERNWGETFALKRYHDTVLSFGSPPVPLVRALILGEEIPR